MNNNPPNETSEKIPQGIRDFLDSLLNDAGMSDLDPSMREQMITELFVRLDNFILTTIVDKLPPEKLEEFTKLSENKASREDLEKYLKENIPNSETVFGDALGEFRDLYLGNIAVARNAPAKNENGSKDLSQNMNVN